LVLFSARSRSGAACRDYTCESVATRNIPSTIPKLKASLTTRPREPDPWITPSIRSINVASCRARFHRVATPGSGRWG
jgi:hypothetical protein